MICLPSKRSKRALWYTFTPTVGGAACALEGRFGRLSCLSFAGMRLSDYATRRKNPRGLEQGFLRVSAVSGAENAAAPLQLLGRVCGENVFVYLKPPRQGNGDCLDSPRR